MRRGENKMEKFVPFEKKSKKEKRKENNKKRNTWGNTNPSTKVIPDTHKEKRENARARDLQSEE